MKNNIRISSMISLRNKNKYFNIFIISILLFVAIVLSSYLKSMNNYIEEDIFKSVYYKMITINLEDDKYNLNDAKEKIKKIDHVINVTNSYSHSNILFSEELKSSKLSGDVEILSANNRTIPKIIKGKNFPDNDAYYMICPVNFYPTDSIDDIKKMTSYDKYDISKKLNNKIIFKYMSNNEKQSYNIEYNLVGLYENSKNNFDENICYVNEKSLIDIAINQYSDDIDIDTGINNITLQTDLYVEIDDYKNVSDVIQKLRSNGYSVERVATISENYFNGIKKNVSRMIYVLIILLIIMIFIVMKKNNNDNKDNYKLLYYLGYTKRRIITISIISNIINCAISLIIFIILNFLLYLLFKIILLYIPFIFNKWNILVDISILPKFIMVYLVLLLLSSFTVCKEFKNEEYNI